MLAVAGTTTEFLEIIFEFSATTLLLVWFVFEWDFGACKLATLELLSC